MADKSMDAYELGDVLAAGPTWKAHAAWSAEYKRDVIVKVYERSGIMSAESLVKEGIRQAREKPQESAVLAGVVFAPADKTQTDSNFTVNFILEKNAREVEMDILERDDGATSYPPGLSEYQVGDDVPVVANSRIRVATVKATGEEVIIKSVRAREITEANAFIREAFTMAYIEHERNCRLVDICFEKPAGKKVYDIHLVLERMEKDVGRDIEQRREDDRFYTEAELLTILLDVGAGLLHAKRFHIAHRDIKPLNIFLDFDNRAKLGDFGSTWTKKQQTFVATGAGTVGYMSPEMREAMMSPYSVEVDPFSCDVYSLGVTLLHMGLLRFPPNLEARMQDVLERNLRGNIEQLEYSDGLMQLIQGMVAYEASFRTKLEAILLRAEELLRLIPESERSNKKKRVIAMCQLANESVRFFDFDRREWMNAISLKSRIPVDEGTFYTIDNNTIYHFGNWKKPLTGQEAGTIDCRGSKYAVRPLPNMRWRRASAGGIKYKEELFVFGGHGIYDDAYDAFSYYDASWKNYSWTAYWIYKSGEVLSLSAPSAWTDLLNMSEGKLSVCPVLFHDKFYLCGYENIDVFDPQTHTFDPVLPLQIPEENRIDRVACLFENRLLIITRTRLHRVTLTSPRTIMTVDHEEQNILPASIAVISGEFLYWPTLKDCRRASLHRAGQIEVL